MAVRGAAGETGATSVWLGGLDGTAWWASDADRPHYPASLVKVVWVTAVVRRAARGELDLAGPVPVHADFASAVSGLEGGEGGGVLLDRDDDQDDATWDALGGVVALGELCRRAIQLSGNLAADLVREQAGDDEVAVVLAEAGCGDGTRIPTGIGDGLARAHGVRNAATARDLGRLLVALPATVEGWMRGQHYRDGIPAGLARAGAGPGTLVANKTGWVDGVAHDLALVRPPDGEPFALVVLTEHETTQETATAHVAAVAARAWVRRR